MKKASMSLLIAWLTPACNSWNCDFLPKREEFVGVAIRKFRNLNDHLSYTIWVEGKYGKQDLHNIISDDRDSLYLYHSIQLGDSILKRQGTAAYHIKGHGKDYFYERQCN